MEPPTYAELFPLTEPVSVTDPPPRYTSSVRHLSLCYYKDEGEEIKKARVGSFKPCIFEVDSTRIILHTLGGVYCKYVSYLFENYRPDLVEPDLNVKSVDLDYSGLPPLQTRQTVASYTPFPDQAFSINRLVNRVCKRSSYLKLSDFESKQFHETCRLVDRRPDLKYLPAPVLSEEEAQIDRLKQYATHSYAFSLQEVVKYGNASDFADRPFSLRVVLASDQLVLSFYNAPIFVQAFHKLNIAHELSLDIDLRSVLPFDYCVPRRRRRHRRHHRRSSPRHRTDSSSSVATTGSQDQDQDDDEPDSTTASFNLPRARLTFEIPPVIPELAVEDDSDNDEQLREIDSSRSASHRSSIFSVAQTALTEETEELKEIPEDADITHMEDLLFAVKCIKNCTNRTRRIL